MSIEFNNLKMYRKQNGFTQEQVAERLGVSRQAVAKWEKGESLPDIESVITLADMYGVAVDFLVRNMGKIPEAKDEKKHIFGYTKINENGQITLPKKAREVFGLKAGDSILILGDEEKGIALVKLGEIFGK